MRRCRYTIATDDLHRNPIHYYSSDVPNCVTREVAVERQARKLARSDQINDPPWFVVCSDNSGDELQLLQSAFFLTNNQFQLIINCVYHLRFGINSDVVKSHEWNHISSGLNDSGTTTRVVALFTMEGDVVCTTNFLTVDTFPLVGVAENVTMFSSSISNMWEIGVVPIIGARVDPDDLLELRF